jgi:uncharacterized short protein YbdD (DUF466 family)
MRDLRVILKRLRQFLGGATGEGEYERYCAHLAKAHPEVPRPSRGEFFRTAQADRWQGVKRCC